MSQQSWQPANLSPNGEDNKHFSSLQLFSSIYLLFFFVISRTVTSEGRSENSDQSDQLLIALRFYASGNFLQVIGDTVGVDKSTVSRAVHDVSQLLSTKQNMFIKWPTTAAVINENKNVFYRRRRFPGIIGCIDGTQIRIIAPSNI